MTQKIAYKYILKKILGIQTWNLMVYIQKSGLSMVSFKKN